MTTPKPNTSPSRPGSLLDRCDAAGSVLSSLCAVHCMCMPVLIGLLPALGLTFLVNDTVEHIASGTMIVFASACVWSGCRFHRRWGLFGLLGPGAGLVLYAQFAGPPEQKAWMETALMALGGGLIVASHLLNRKRRARCHCSQCNAARKNDSQSALET